MIFVAFPLIVFERFLEIMAVSLVPASKPQDFPVVVVVVVVAVVVVVVVVVVGAPVVGTSSR